MTGKDADEALNLGKFVAAQSPVFETVLGELKAGRKRSHWMWFIFPQLKGLGRSSTAAYYGIASKDEACAYLAHSLLGPRLDLCTRLVIASAAPSLNAIFGSPDDMKFVSCMTLFAIASEGQPPVFQDALDRYAGGQHDQQTLALLGVEAADL